MYLRSNDPSKYRVSSKLKTGLTLGAIYRASQVVLFVSLSLFLFYSQNSIQIPETLINRVYKIKSLFYSSANSFYSYTSKMDLGVTDYIALRSKYEALQNENNLLKIKTNELSIIESENNQLRKVLNLISSTKLTVVKTANIVMRSVNNQELIAHIDAGLEDGIKEGNVVLNSRGIVGRIVEVGQHTSKILLVTSPSSQIPGVFANSGAKVIVGGGHNGKLVVKISQKDSIAEVGELVITSSDSRIVPPGIPIGRSSKISERDIEITPEFTAYNTNFVSVVS